MGSSSGRWIWTWIPHVEICAWGSIETPAAAYVSKPRPVVTEKRRSLGTSFEGMYEVRRLTLRLLSVVRLRAAARDADAEHDG